MENVKNQSIEHSRGGESSSQAIPTVEESLSLPINELLSRLGSSLSGLSSEEAEKRLTVYGYNELAKRKKRVARASISALKLRE
jgi:magnesium-transporting ATPase (P-type)